MTQSAMDILLFVFYRPLKVLFTFRLKNFFVLNFDKIVETDVDIVARPSSCIFQQYSISPINLFKDQQGRHKINVEMLFCFFNSCNEILKVARKSIFWHNFHQIYFTIYSVK